MVFFLVNYFNSKFVAVERLNVNFKVTNFSLNSILILFTVILSLQTFAQRQTEKDELYQNAYENVYSNPEKTITVSEYLISNAGSKEEKAKALNLKAETSVIQGKYIVALNVLLEAVNLNQNENSEEFILTHLILSDLYRQLGVISKAEKNLSIAQEFYNKESVQNLTLSLQISYATAALFIEKLNYKEAINTLDERILDNASEEFPYIVSKSYNQLAKAYLVLDEPDSALYFAIKSKKLAETTGLDENFKVYAELELAKAYYQKKESQSYLSLVPQLLKSSQKVQDDVLKRNIHQFFSEIYRNQNDNMNYQSHNLKYLELNESVNLAQQKARDLILSLNDASFNSHAIENRGINQQYVLIGIVVFAVILLSLIFWYRYQTKQKYNYYNDYIKKLKTKEKPEFLEVENFVSESSKTNQVIPEKTEQILLEKLFIFENGTDFTQKNLTLNSLAKDLDTNTRYLSEIINKHKQKNFNAYINELRVNYIIEKLRNEPKFLNYKISYLAEESGFSSHTAFSTVFKSVTEISPKEFINFIKKESLTVNV